MYHKYQTKGIILWSKTEGDDSKRVHIFTEIFGFVNAKIQGVRQNHSKLRPGAQDFSVGDFSLVHGRGGWKVVGVKSKKNIFELLHHSKEKLKVSANVLKLLKKLTGEEEANASLFNIVSNFLDFIIDAKEDNISLAECLVLLRILHSLGYMRYDPDLSIPISYSEMQIKDLEMIAPKRSKVINLINESLKATQI